MVNYKEIQNIVYNYSTKYEKGFTSDETQELLKTFPNINMNFFNYAMGINTVTIKDENIIYYRYDIFKAIIAALENRALTILEWD